MSTIAVQTAVNHAVTELSYSLGSMVNVGEFQYGASNEGIFILNSGDTDNEVPFTRSFTLATSDFGIQNYKKIRRIAIGFEGSLSFTLLVKFDDQEWIEYPVSPRKTGLQQIVVPIDTRDQGRYITIKISSTNSFKIDRIEGLFIVRPLGISGY